MKNKFKITTLICLWLRWFFGKQVFEFNMLGSQQRLTIRHRHWQSFKSFLFDHKQVLIVDKLGYERLLNMTISEILSYKL